MPASLASDTRIEPATLDDLAALTELVMELMDVEADFEPDRRKQENGIRLILEQPNRGRIFVLRNDHRIFGMVNLLFTISTAEGGFVILMEDFIIHPQHRGTGHGGRLMDYVMDFAREKNFKRITLLTDRISAESPSAYLQRGALCQYFTRRVSRNFLGREQIGRGEGAERKAKARRDCCCKRPRLVRPKRNCIETDCST